MARFSVVMTNAIDRGARVDGGEGPRQQRAATMLDEDLRQRAAEALAPAGGDDDAPAAHGRRTALTPS